MTQNTYYVGGAAVSPFVLERMLTVTGLRWVMSRAQWTAIHTNPGDTETLALFRNFYGIPVEVRYNFPNNVIELRQGAFLVSRTEQLAIPIGFEND